MVNGQEMDVSKLSILPPKVANPRSPDLALIKGAALYKDLRPTAIKQSRAANKIWDGFRWKMMCPSKQFRWENRCFGERNS